ncbi:prepilin-type N-terminal cleavage/methylation domain-containing protein [Sulfurimonas paralvinellae]|uniref:Prepilin-type N-terminal cleavage/methylation domain-containing protein n=1 Tax=Sulfurimonas paralvinellae TaxID=317658 RepID=A0A7M1B9E7_9BACT|nr:prepilin-type N-terminal cleavage/methylation domain-containing protein [Sulfurimonas paralvinellae]QOP46349.1 prepilin-type N-terminal cleavage/methylation domain-containing protein [Sulfurimonas paralvinellae]
MMRRYAFTMIELIFVIVVMGILGKYGVEFLAQAYHNYIFAQVNNQLQADAEMAVETIAARLQYRIKASVIGRKSSDNTFVAIQSASGTQYNILEWVGSDEESFRGKTAPYWSGIIDLDDSNATYLASPGTNTAEINNIIDALAHNSGTDINDSAIYFVGSNSNSQQWGWTIPHAAFIDQSNAMHPIQTDANTSVLIPKVGSFSGEDVYEYYKLAWTAYAVGIKDYDAATNKGTLTLWYDYQPWEGDDYTKATTQSSVIMENVSTFQFRAVGSVIKIQVCVKSDLIEDEKYSLCKEKTVF